MGNFIFKPYHFTIDETGYVDDLTRPIYPAHPGALQFWGNFYAISHVFHVITRDASLIERLTRAIRSNQERPDYLAQPVPEPLPPCPHCDPTANPPSECGRH